MGKTITSPIQSDIITTAFKVTFEVFVLYIIERILDYVETRVARRRLVVKEQYRYAKFKIRLPIVGKLHFGGDAQIRTRRRAAIFLFLFIVTTVLELNINGTSRVIDRPLKPSEIKHNYILIRPHQPLKNTQAILEQLISNDFEEKWSEIQSTSMTPRKRELQYLAWAYVKMAVKFIDEKTTYLRSMLCELKFRNVSDSTNVVNRWSLRNMAIVNSRVDVKLNRNDGISGSGKSFTPFTANETNHKACNKFIFLQRTSITTAKLQSTDTRLSNPRLMIFRRNRTMLCENGILFDGNSATAISQGNNALS